mgnify:CR=1 FL=1
MRENCATCKFKDEFNFCDKLVVDTRRVKVENEKWIKAFYLDNRVEDDERNAFMVPLNFKCNLFIRKDRFVGFG